MASNSRGRPRLGHLAAPTRDQVRRELRLLPARAIHIARLPPLRQGGNETARWCHRSRQQNRVGVPELGRLVGQTVRWVSRRQNRLALVGPGNWDEGAPDMANGRTDMQDE